MGFGAGLIGAARYILSDSTALGDWLPGSTVILASGVLLGLVVGISVGLLRPIARRGVGGAVATGAVIGAGLTVAAALIVGVQDERFLRFEAIIFVLALGALGGSIQGLMIWLLWVRR